MGRWVTLDDDQKVFISDGGKVLATRSAISKASGGTERGKALAGRSKAAILKAKGAKEAKPTGTGTGSGGAAESAGPVKSGPQALRDMYAAQARHKSLQGKLDAGDKSVTKEHVASAREDLRVSRVELLRTKLHQEKQQVEQTTRAAAPGAAKAAGRGTPERAAEAAKIAELRGKMRATAEKFHAGPMGGARLSTTANEPPKFKDKLDAIKSRVAERGERASIAQQATKDQARSSADTRRFGRELTPKERMARDAQAGGVRVKREAGNDYAGKRISEVPKSEGLTRARAVIAARATSQPRPAATPAPKSAPSLREQAAAARAGKGPKVVPPDRLIRSGRKFYTPEQMTTMLKAAGKKRATIDEFLKNPPAQRRTDPIVGAMVGRVRAGMSRLKTR